MSLILSSLQLQLPHTHTHTHNWNLLSDPAFWCLNYARSHSDITWNSQWWLVRGSSSYAHAVDASQMRIYLCWHVLAAPPCHLQVLYWSLLKAHSDWGTLRDLATPRPSDSEAWRLWGMATLTQGDAKIQRVIDPFERGFVCWVCRWGQSCCCCGLWQWWAIVWIKVEHDNSAVIYLVGQRHLRWLNNNNVRCCFWLAQHKTTIAEFQSH